MAKGKRTKAVNEVAESGEIKNAEATEFVSEATPSEQEEHVLESTPLAETVIVQDPIPIPDEPRIRLDAVPYGHYRIEAGDLENHPELAEQVSVGDDVRWSSLWVTESGYRVGWPRDIGQEKKGITFKES